MEITVRNLLDLKPDAMLTVRVRSRVIMARLRRAPKLVHRGKPGLNRVDLEVTDVEAVSKLGDEVSNMAILRHIHNVSGSQVVSIG